MVSHKTGKRVLQKQYTGLVKQEIIEEKYRIIKHFFEEIEEKEIEKNCEKLERDMVNAFSGARAFRSLIVPYRYEKEPADFGRVNLYTFSKLPEDFKEKYLQLHEAVNLQQFPLRARILAALNLSDAFASIKEYFFGILYSLCMEDIYVNIENGEIKILLERCLSPAFQGKRGKDFYFECSDGASKEASAETGLLDFLAYAEFRILCAADPFDGRETLMQYPYLSTLAMEQIHNGSYGFIFSDNENKCSQYAGQFAKAKWRELPAFIRTMFTQVFEEKTKGIERQMSFEDWLTQMRKLRDCLVYVKRKFKLCDPQEQNKVLFIKINEFKIPVWPNKAIYWYHTTFQYEDGQEGLIGGINKEGFLENYTDQSWHVEGDDDIMYLCKGDKVELKKGMKIQLSIHGEAEIIDGGSSTDSNDISVLEANDGSSGGGGLYAE